MKRWVLAPLLFGVVTLSYGQTDLLYVGGGLGNSKLKEGSAAGIMEDGSFSAFKSDNRDAYYELALGLRFNKHLYAELGYQTMGHFSATGRSDGSSVLSAGGYAGELDITLAKASLIYNIPTNSSYNTYLRAGMHHSKLEQTLVGVESDSTRSHGMHYGIGIGVVVSRAWQLQLEYVRYENLSYRNFSDGSEGDMTASTLGGRWLYLF